MDSESYIARLIAEGEHVQQDFKFEISDLSKIAHTLSAFSNTEGGRLLIGVKDNGKIAGIRSEEELYMIEAAAEIYSFPPVTVETRPHCVKGKTVLEVWVPKADRRPVFAIESTGDRKAYLRITDENFLATPVHLHLWRQEGETNGALFSLSDHDTARLLLLLQEKEMLSLNQFRRTAIRRNKLYERLAMFVRLGVVSMIFYEGTFCFRLNEESPLSLSE